MLKRLHKKQRVQTVERKEWKKTSTFGHIFVNVKRAIVSYVINHLPQKVHSENMLSYIRKNTNVKFVIIFYRVLRVWAHTKEVTIVTKNTLDVQYAIADSAYKAVWVDMLSKSTVEGKFLQYFKSNKYTPITYMYIYHNLPGLVTFFHIWTGTRLSS